MNKSFKAIATAGVTLSLMGVFFLSTAKTAQAAYLYWGSTAVKTASTKTCFDFAYDTMRNLNFQNIRRSQNEVAGSSGGSYAAITCFATTPRATAIVMVVGDNGNETARVRDDLRNKIAGIIRFD
ncbi:hypothetical protein C7B65_07315 [Phormidesmis priestleyi ULC007]|uniref:Uncharacterized protein n=1 Tax=Phormidesmis priestleyi ULC007 TaxID=1920490 RepID=A0A2T1DJP5_9CYAN|nr:hypothetical protein [Phormidesmis priestleyi]PSB20696.1 hypothetical protein C7B65_07315 [Phormidesmis priestleyi ULC007]PZO47119.1 MAG: hypothetical protein DCF14_20780 [Phormidesmis priestleyi]